MGVIIYSTITSLDGYIADVEGKFDWSEPDEEVHIFINQRMRSVGTHLYGRRLYEVMQFWEEIGPDEDSAAMREFAEIWKATDKIVYSSTLTHVASSRTRIQSYFDPADVRAILENSESDVSVGGADLAGQAILAGLVDEFHQYVSPVVVGGGTRALPDGVRWDLELVEERRFENGVVFSRYRTRTVE